MDRIVWSISFYFTKNDLDPVIPDDPAMVSQTHDSVHIFKNLPVWFQWKLTTECVLSVQFDNATSVIETQNKSSAKRGNIRPKVKT